MSLCCYCAMRSNHFFLWFFNFFLSRFSSTFDFSRQLTTVKMQLAQLSLIVHSPAGLTANYAWILSTLAQRKKKTRSDWEKSQANELCMSIWKWRLLRARWLYYFFLFEFSSCVVFTSKSLCRTWVVVWCAGLQSISHPQVTRRS